MPKAIYQNIAITVFAVAVLYISSSSRVRRCWCTHSTMAHSRECSIHHHVFNSI